jgi:hypothetical protein
MSLQPAASPVPQSGFEPQAVVQLLLLLLANGLMVPRALHTCTIMWFTGTCSGMLLAAGQLGMLCLQTCISSSSSSRSGAVAAAACSAASGGSAQSLGQYYDQMAQLVAGLGWPWLSSSSGSSLWPGAVGTGSASGLWPVYFLLAWLVLCAAVLQWGWRVMLAGHK